MTAGALRLLPLAALAAACARPAPERAAFVFRVADDSGAPVPGAPIFVDGKPFAATDASGEARGLLPIRDGGAYRIGHGCPPGYRPAEAESELRAHALGPLRRSAGGASVLVRRRCDPLQLRHVLVVRTGGRAGLPVRVLGRVASVTDADGVALAVVSGAPGEEIEVAIDTSGAPRLRPASPVRRIPLPAARSFFVFDQRFEERAKRAPGRSRARAIPRRL